MNIRRFAYGLVFLVLLAGAAAVILARNVQAEAHTSPASVIQWNQIAQRTTVQVAKMYISQSEIYMAYVQAAVYDAVVSIQGHYQPYALNLTRRPGASVDAAVASAAHDVLVHYFPTQHAALDADYAASLAAIPNGPRKVDGIRAGQDSAAGIIALRQGDGVEANTGFTMPAPAIGVWQLPNGQTPQTPWLAKMKPFLLERPDQFRPAQPPALTSQQWANEYNEIKSLGAANSTTRTPEQTDIARFFSGNAVVQYNTAYQAIIQSRGLDALQAARLYAMGNLVGADAGIACFDGKYTYLFWRPVFAIHQGDQDGNPATAGDATWTPLLATPNHPEYPAAHGCMTSAQAEVFAAFLGTRTINLDLTSAVPNLVKTTRHYQTVSDLETEIVNARVWGGIHYRGSVEQGVALGRAVAQWSLARYFQSEPTGLLRIPGLLLASPNEAR